MTRPTRSGGAALPCPRCGTTVLRTPTGEHLDPAPHPLAIHRPDGTDLTAADALDQLRRRAPPAGHHLHTCPAPQQLALII